MSRESISDLVTQWLEVDIVSNSFAEQFREEVTNL